MIRIVAPSRTLRRYTYEVGALLLIFCVSPTHSRGQATVEAAGAASSSAGVAAGVTKALPASLPHPGTDSASPFIPAQDGPPPEETNRRALEQRAGQDAAKLLLQSVPSDARIHIDGMFVGRTPLFLIVPPGKYKVEMRGKREEFGEDLVGLSPNETQRLTLALALRYPDRISMHTGRDSATEGVTTLGSKVFPASSLPHTRTKSSPMPLAASEGPAPDEMNRIALEQRAGQDAAKLLLQSEPSEAMAFVDGMFVGRTPVLLTVPPGKYQVEMRGKREEFGERLVGLLPNETQQLTLTLVSRYPATISVR